EKMIEETTLLTVLRIEIMTRGKKQGSPLSLEVPVPERAVSDVNQWMHTLADALRCNESDAMATTAVSHEKMALGRSHIMHTSNPRSGLWAELEKKQTPKHSSANMQRTTALLLLCVLFATASPLRKRLGGVDYPSGDLAGMPISVSNSSECRQKCQANSNCAVYVFDSCGGSLCWLKGSNFGAAREDPCRESGGNPNYVGRWDLKTERGGNDMPNMPVIVTSDFPLAECQALCLSTSGCVAWALRTCEGPQKCYLKSSISDRSPLDCVASSINPSFNGGWQMNTDRGGADMNIITFPGNSTVADCWAACNGNPKCTGYAFDTCGGQTCWLKNGNPVDPGQVQCRASGMSQTFHGDWDEKTDRGGSDLPNMPIMMPEGSAAINCKARCDGRGDCAAWVYNKCGNKCWLKNAQPKPGPNDCSISGLNRGWNPPPPPPPPNPTNNGVITYYNCESGQQGACGGWIKNSDAEAAVGDSMFKNGAACGKQVRLSGPRGSLVVTIRDSCGWACEYGHFDICQGAFGRIADPNDGLVKVKWAWV
ncbi:hypothetical protein PROFUN_15510, partial [Planoprotostelium fungivorum]